MNNNLPTMSKFLTDEKTKKYLENMLGNKSEQFVTALATMVGQNAQLNLCDRNSIMGCALKAVGMGLSFDPNLGFCYVIPYNDNRSGDKIATFQMGVKGFIQLAQRSGQIKKLNAMEVREGEFVGRDASGDPIIKWLDEDDRESKTIVGYMAFIQTNNNFDKTIYWSLDKIKKHAEKYSQAYKYALKSGNGARAVWVDNFDAMAKKTVLKSLIKDYAPMSVELQQAVQYDQARVSVDLDTGKEVIEYVDNQEEEKVELINRSQVMILAPLSKDVNLEEVIGYKTLKEVPSIEFDLVKKKLEVNAGVVNDNN